MNIYGFKQQKRIISILIMVMMVTALAFKAIIPAGFMPESKGGFMELVICSGMGEKTIIVPSEDPQSPSHQNKKADKACAFQALTSGKALVPAPIALLPVPDVTQVPAVISNNSVAPSFYQLSFEARGPPSA